jgi:hypothetical protein
MIVTLQNVHKLKFPVYMLPSEDWERSDGLVFMEGLILDDRNMEGETLGIRRLQTPFQKSLFQLNKSFPSLVALALQKSGKCYIDSRGTCFIYEKTVFCDVKYHEISKVTRKEYVSTLTLKGIKSTFQIPRPPPDGTEWAGVLYYHGLPWKLFDFSKTKKKDIRKKV